MRRKLGQSVGCSPGAAGNHLGGGSGYSELIQFVLNLGPLDPRD